MRNKIFFLIACVFIRQVFFQPPGFTVGYLLLAMFQELVDTQNLDSSQQQRNSYYANFDRLPTVQASAIPKIPHSSRDAALPLHHPDFKAEMEEERHIGTYASVTFKLENLCQFLVRIFCYCNCIVPSETHSLMVTNKRIIATKHELWSETIFDQNSSQEFVKHLTSIDLHRSSSPWRLHHLCLQASWFFQALYILTGLLFLVAGASGFGSLAAHAALTFVTALAQSACIISVIGLLIHNGVTDRFEVNKARAIVFLLSQGFVLILSTLTWISSFLVYGLYVVTQNRVDVARNGAIAYMTWNAIMCILYIVPFSIYPYYAHPNKTQMHLVYQTMTGARSQQLRLEQQVADQAQANILALKRDIECMDKKAK